MVERKPRQQVTYYPRVGLSEVAISLLQRIAESGVVGDEENDRLVVRLRGAAGFLAKASWGMQWVDFGNRQDPQVREDHVRNEIARSLVLGTLLPMVYPDITIQQVSGALDTTKRAEVHKILTSIRNVLLKTADRQRLFPQEVEQMPRVIEFFKRFGIKEW